jgi:hypothetical protein
MKIDVLFPFHRNNDFFLESIASLQASRDVELNPIFIDDRADKSIDLSDIFKTFPTYVYIKTTGEVGYGEALRLGSQAINSSYVALMNSDDLISPYRLIKQIKHLENSEISITRMHRINSNNFEIKSYLSDSKGSVYDPIFLILGAYGANATWCMHSNWWKQNAFYDSGQCLDWRIALKSFYNSEISYLSEPLYFYRKHNYQVTKSKLVDFSEMKPTYLLWNDFLKNYNLSNIGYELFSHIATPWNTDINSLNVDFFYFYNQLITIADKLDETTNKDFVKILKRRSVLALLKTNDLNSIGRLFRISGLESFRFLGDVLHNTFQSVRKITKH